MKKGKTVSFAQKKKQELQRQAAVRKEEKRCEAIRKKNEQRWEISVKVHFIAQKAKIAKFNILAVNLFDVLNAAFASIYNSGKEEGHVMTGMVIAKIKNLDKKETYSRAEMANPEFAKLAEASAMEYTAMFEFDKK